MKFLRLILFFTIFYSPEIVYSQEGRLTLAVENTPVQEVLKSIEEQTGYRFFYNNDEIDITLRVNISLDQVPLKKGLAQLFKKLPYSFSVLDNKVILVHPKKEASPAEALRDQNVKEITGSVFDITGNPLPGVTVMVEGSPTGTITDNNGGFFLTLSDSLQTLVFSFVGLQTQKIKVKKELHLLVILMEEQIDLEEVVVIGYGSIKKSDLTGAVSVVPSSVLEKIPVNDFTRAIQGRASGIIVSKTGTPGELAQIRVRGVGSINQNPEPTYVIDGVVTNNLTSVNASDIENIQILKDASAGAIYGADGANGVIIISTRRGEKGKPRLYLSNYVTINKYSRQFEMLNADGYSTFYSELLSKNNKSVPVAYQEHFRKWYYGEGWETGTNWQNEITRVAYGQNHNMHLSGGGEGSNYFVSANYYTEQGVLLSSADTRYNIRANSDFKIGKYIKIGENLSLSRSLNQTAATYEGNPWKEALITSPLMRIYNENNKGGFEGPQIPYTYQIPDGSEEVVVNTGANDKVNPLAPLKLIENKTFFNNILASAYLEINPVKGLIFRIMPSVDLSYIRIKNWSPAFDLGVRSQNQARLEEDYTERFVLSLENQVTYTRSLKNHNFTITAVHNARKSDTNYLETTATGFPYEQLDVLSQSYEAGREVLGYYTPFTSESYLGRLIYDFKNKYLLTGSIRHDGNSRFGLSNRWGTFPSVSAAWKLNEDFFPDSEKISMLKLRLGWGKTGNSNIGYFQYMSLIDEFNNFSPVFGVEQKKVAALNVIHHFGNPSIKWEAAGMLNFGLDIALFDNKVQLSIENFVKNQNDLLVKIPISAAYGRVSGEGDPWVNLGELKNEGFELSGIYKEQTGPLKFDITSQVLTLKNRVKYIPSEVISGNNITKNGHTVGSFYGYVAERILTASDFDTYGQYLHAMPATGKPEPGDLKFKDLNNDGTINDQDRTIIGKAVPDFIYSLGMEVFFKNFDFSVFFYGLQNFNVYNHLRVGIEGFSSQDIGHNKLKEYALNYYTPERPSTKYIRADLNNSNQNDRPSTWFLEDGSFLRLEDIQLGYSFPREIINQLGLSQVRLFLNVANVFTLTRYTGRDPESPTVSEPLTPGNDSGSYPIPGTITTGIQVSF